MRGEDGVRWKDEVCKEGGVRGRMGCGVRMG